MTRDERGWFQPEPIAHGTYNGSEQHKRRGEKPCELCLPARRAYRRAQYHRAAARREPAPPLQLDRARELADMGLLYSMPAWQLAERLGRDPRTIERYRARLRGAA